MKSSFKDKFKDKILTFLKGHFTIYKKHPSAPIVETYYNCIQLLQFQANCCPRPCNKSPRTQVFLNTCLGDLLQVATKLSATCNKSPRTQEFFNICLADLLQVADNPKMDQSESFQP